MGLYMPLGGHPRQSQLEWIFQSRMKMKFAHLEYDKTVYDYQGAQIAYLGFDELTHFTAFQFFYMLSRNRSMSGIPGYVRATMNPDPDSFVRGMIDWYINPETGYPIPERSGKIRYFIRKDDELIWANSREELIDRYGVTELPKSFTFIPSRIHDNQILMKSDPAYLANLQALSKVEQERLIYGNWNIKESAGNVFREEWFPVIDAIPAGWTHCVRFWDRAASKVSALNPSPDWTRGLKLYKYSDGSYVVGDLKSMRDVPGAVENLIRNVASHDGRKVKVMCQQDPGSAGVAEAQFFVRMLGGYNVRTVVFTKDKLTRSKPVSAQAYVGNIRILRAPWNKEFFQELENFPDGAHDDIVDVLSASYNELALGNSTADLYKNWES
jgi:predicted phage terminase large subunit-like protein